MALCFVKSPENSKFKVHLLIPDTILYTLLNILWSQVSVKQSMKKLMCISYDMQYIYRLTFYMVASAETFVKFVINWIVPITVTSHGRHDFPIRKQFDCCFHSLFRWTTNKNSFFWLASPWPIDSPHKGPVTRKMFWCQDVILRILTACKL